MPRAPRRVEIIGRHSSHRDTAVGPKRDPLDRAIRIAEYVRHERDNHPPSPTSVYIMFDAWWRCLYVGISKVTPGRFVQHAADKPWYQDIAEARFEHYPNREVAALREKWLIEQLKPIHNVIRARPCAGTIVHTEWQELESIPPWPLVEALSIPLTRDERAAYTPVDMKADGLLYDRLARSARKVELDSARHAGRVTQAARAIAKRIQHSEGVYIADALAAVDDYHFVAVAGLLMLTEGDDAPVRRMLGGALMEKKKYAALAGA